MTYMQFLKTKITVSPLKMKESKYKINGKYLMKIGLNEAVLHFEQQSPLHLKDERRFLTLKELSPWLSLKHGIRNDGME